MEVIMKRLPMLILAALAVLCALTNVQADTKTCSCTCQCATPTNSLSGTGSISAIPKPPAPVLAEAVNDELDLQTLGAADATIEVTYPEIADGHTMGLYWTSAVQQYRAPVHTVNGGEKTVTFKVPNATVVKDLNLSPVVTASVGVANESLVISEPLTFKVVSGAPPGNYPQPTLPTAGDNQVDIGALTEDLKVSVHYPTMAQGQIVKVLWRGTTSYDTPLRITPDGNPLEFTIPQATVAASLGTLVNLRYEVTLDGQAGESSAPAPVNIILRTLGTSPVVAGAVNGVVDLRTLMGNGLKVTYTYPAIAAGHTVGIRWAGDPVYDTPHPAIGETPRPLEFTIPYDKVRLERDKTVAVTASVGIGDGRLAVSPVLSLQIVDTRPKVEEVAADLNARYNDTAATCNNNLPSYYCNGVTTRGTKNEGYDPWDPSPTALRKKSQSFSYLRKDSKVTLLARNSGFALLPQTEAIAQRKAYEYLCSYPHDAWTDLVGRPGNGCGLQPKANEALINALSANPELGVRLKADDTLVEQLTNDQLPKNLRAADPKLADLLGKAPDIVRLLKQNQRDVEQWQRNVPKLADLSTCSSVNAATLTEWNIYTVKLTHPSHQCSLSAQTATQFETSIQARGYAMPVMYSTWNELLIKVWDAGIPEQLPLQAFYYQNATGLPEAKEYQRKYVAKTAGQWLPVIKLDPTKFNGNPFSYNEADQAVQQ
jgi:hypothetical protein